MNTPDDYSRQRTPLRRKVGSVVTSRNGNRMKRFKRVLDLLPKGHVFDGELVVLDDAGRPLFNELLFGRRRPTYVAFDLLIADDIDLRPLSLRQRMPPPVFHAVMKGMQRADQFGYALPLQDSLNRLEEEISMRHRFEIAWFAALAVFASAADAATEPLIVQVPQISSAAAQQLGEACVAFAAKANTATAVAVVDPAGHLLYFFARQGASPTAPKTAELKAVTAARWRRATSQLMDQVKKGNAESLWFGDFPQAGGVPIIQDGHTLGAIGVAGPGGNDEKCAMEAIKAVFGNSVETGRPVGDGAAARDGQSGKTP